MNPSSNEKHVYLVRHGQSVANAQPVYQPVDTPLSELGRNQASRIADRLSTISFETLLASPLPRAKETADFIATKTGKVPEYCDLFVERKKPSGLGGKSVTDGKANQVWKAWEASLFSNGPRVEDGENFDDIMRRADAALDFIVNRREERMVIVTHGFFLKALVLRTIFGKELDSSLLSDFHRRVPISNTGLSHLKYGDYHGEKAWLLMSLNDHAHLQ